MNKNTNKSIDNLQGGIVTIYTLTKSIKLSGEVEISLDVLHQKALVNNRLLPLTNIEFQLLYIFIENANQILTNSHILKMVWGFEPQEGHTLKVHLHRLKKKLLKVLTKDDLDIISIRKSGYMLVIKNHLVD